MRIPTPTRRVLRFALLPAAVALACGSESPEEQLQAATEVMNAAEAVFEQAETKLQDREAELVAAQEARDAAALALEEAQESLAQAEAKVGMFATDDLLFRLVQQRLLDDPALTDVAVEARVANGRVTLSGFVPDAVTRDAAVEIAGGVTGVRGVTSRLRIGANAPEEPEAGAAASESDAEAEVEPEAEVEEEAAEEVPALGEADAGDAPVTEEEAAAGDEATPQIPIPEEFRAPLEEESAAPEART